MKIKHKTYIDNSRFMEFVDEIATQLTEEKFKEDCYYWYGENEDKMIEEAQDFYNERYDEVETLVNNIMGVYSDKDEKK